METELITLIVIITLVFLLLLIGEELKIYPDINENPQVRIPTPNEVPNQTECRQGLSL